MQTSTSPQVTAPDSLAALLPSWQRHLRAANLAPRTVQSYGEAAEQFGAFLASRGMPTNIGAIRREHVESYVEHLVAHWRPATAANRYRSLQQLFRWLVDEGEVQANPMGLMRPPKVPEQPVPVPSTDEQARLLAACAGNSFAARRDAAMLVCSSTPEPGWPKSPACS